MSLIKWTTLYEPFLDVERAFNDLALTSNYNPAIDLYEKDDALVVEVALAGIDPENVHVKVENNVLSLEGTTEKRSEVDEKNYYRKEVRSGSFHRVISLPTTVNSEGGQAEYEKGLLRITLPKKEEIKPKAIDITIKK